MSSRRRLPEGIPPGEIIERHFTLHTAEQIQQPVAQQQPTTETPKEGDWVVDTGEEGSPRPPGETNPVVKA